MNRKIKFRVWYKLTNQFINHCSVGNGVIQHDTENFVLLNSDNCVVQQFTGHFDKNKVDIYEGDIVKTRKDHNEFRLCELFGEPLAEYTAGIVKFVNCQWRICQRHIGASEFIRYTCCDGEHAAALEVIGNVFENPELLSWRKG